MRRPINWVVFCLSLLMLIVNLTFGPKAASPVVQAVVPRVTERLDFSHVVVGEPPTPQFGYVRADGSFQPLADAKALTSASPSWQ